MPNLAFYFNQEEMDELNELRIDSIREGNEMTAQQVVKSLIHEKFMLKHGSKNAPVVEEKEIEHERAENKISFDKYWTVNDAMSFIKEQTGQEFDDCVIYNAARKDEINYLYIGNKYLFRPQDVKKFLDNRKNNNTRKTNKVPPPHSEERTEKARFYGRAA